jgi:hypothetical protein
MNDALLLPKLRHTRWIGWTEVAGRDLFDKPVANGLPRLGVGEDTPQRFSFVTPEGLADAHRTWGDVESVALANLRKRPATWTVTKKRGGVLGIGAKPARLSFVDEFACERLLDADFLNQAHRLLATELLAVAVPARGIIFAGRGVADLAEMSEFLAVAERAFCDVPANMEPVSPAVFAVQAGKLVGVVLGQPQRTDEVTPSRGFPWPTREVTLAPSVQPPGAAPPPARLTAADLASGEELLLQFVGYAAATSSVEYSCYLDANVRIPADEVQRLARVAAAGYLPDGRPIGQVRVVFLDRAMALRGQAQLAKTGARMVYMDESGVDVELPPA